jgi:uncharacterized membrane protein YkoI
MKMSRIMILVRLAAFYAVLAGAPIAAFAYAGQELASGAQVRIDQARAIALKTVPGQIIDEELEKEEGGSGLRYTFNIKRGTDTYEVGIDARTGAVLENIIEGQ